MKDTDIEVHRIAALLDGGMAPEEIAERLVRLARHPYVAPEQAGESAVETRSELDRIFHLLRTATGNDFTHYQRTTTHRRIQRRMVFHGSEKLGDYIAYLQENPAELRALADDLLICVTSFFREPEAFEALATRVFPEILKNRALEDAIRIWVPGCATGDEAYSIAILLTEFLERSGAAVPLQIFATDISEKAIEKARAGTYQMPSLAAVSPERLKRFFVKVNGRYQVHKSIRETCLFALQSITRDPPFNNLDLISCCNVLIYFDGASKSKVVQHFFSNLNLGGYFFLGTSESLMKLNDQFHLVHFPGTIAYWKPSASSGKP